jgi:transposase InsO family protein
MCLILLKPTEYKGYFKTLIRSMTKNWPRLSRIAENTEGRSGPDVIWAHENGVTLRFIEPGKPNQNAHVEFFNGRLRDECLNEHWFTGLAPCARAHRGLAPVTPSPNSGPRLEVEFPA